MAHSEGREAAAKAIEEKLGPIDIWINNAMVSGVSPFLEMELEEFRRTTDATYLGYMHGTLAALKCMIPRDRGTIVQVGAPLAFNNVHFQFAYSGAKRAIQEFTESIQAELAELGSRVHLAMVQLPVSQPEVCARAIYWAAHHRRRHLYVGGSNTAIVFLDKLDSDSAASAPQIGPSAPPVKGRAWLTPRRAALAVGAIAAVSALILVRRSRRRRFAPR
jgi:NAD(P)-dependent dehydrogenase (short-subunit alcohol dehydrogenase family)